MKDNSRGYAQVLAVGQYASVQDNGRPGFEKYGIPPSGYIINNDITQQMINAIEFFGIGLSLRFSNSVTLHIHGIGVSIRRNEDIFHDVRIISVKAGDIISIIKNEGNLGYIFTEKGWIYEKSMGSYSQMKGITLFDRLYKGIAISYLSDHSDIIFTESQKPQFTTKEFVVYASKGPEFIKYKTPFKELNLTIHKDRNRQAICFTENLNGNFSEIKSSYTPVGTIQITKAGKVYILGRDGQTTGGYFRWGFIRDKDLEKFYLNPPGTKVVIKISDP